MGKCGTGYRVAVRYVLPVLNDVNGKSFLVGN